MRADDWRCLNAAAAEFGPSNPFYAPSTLPFGAPPFDRIKDEDYQPAMEAGMAQQLAEIDAIANNRAAPTFENTFAAMERSGRLLARTSAAFNGVSEANTILFCRRRKPPGTAACRASGRDPSE